MSDTPDSFGALLNAFRLRRHLTQQQVATKLGVHRNTIGTWERGEYLPESKGLVLELTRSLYLSDEEGRRLLEASFTAPAPLWSIPFPRNPLFTGREEVLEVLHRRLGSEPLVALTHSYALHGLGGVGKTQVALEYAYRHALEYSAIGWISAETIEALTASLVRLAEIFQLPERSHSDQQRILAAVQRWLTSHSQWLLIWDNLEDFDFLPRFLPPARQGAVLITTRRQALGTLVQGLDLAPMVTEEGRLLLLRRAKMLLPDATPEQVQQVALSQPADYAAAGQLVYTLGGLPLALDQAAAYIEETGCRLVDYLHRYEQQSTRLLARRGEPGGDHPQSVATTFQLALAQTERQPAAADLLRVCSVLYAEAIPEEMFVAGAAHLGPTLAPLADDPAQFDQMVAVLRSLSLVQRQAETQTLSLHRLVQAVIRAQIGEEERIVWLNRVIGALNATFPTAAISTWGKKSERFLPHALAVTAALPDQAGDQTLLELLAKIAEYLRESAQYVQAEVLYQRSLRVGTALLGPEHPAVAGSLYGLGMLYYRQGQYQKAEPLFWQALTLREQALGPTHSDVALTLNGLANLYGEQSKYEHAEPLWQRAVAIWEQASGPQHTYMAAPLNNLAEIYAAQGRFDQAEPFYERALAIWELAVGPEHPRVAIPLYNLAHLYVEQGMYAQAEPLYQRALAIQEQTVGPEHPLIAVYLAGLAHLYAEQEKDAQAESLFQRALAIQEHHLGAHHPETAETLYDLALLRQKQKHLSEARALAERALSIRSQVLGANHPKTLTTRMLYTQLDQSPEK